MTWMQCSPGSIEARFDEEKAVDGNPSNNPEARLQQLLATHRFPAGQMRKRIETSAGLFTSPDWVDEATKVAVYLDGMSRGLHGDPKTIMRDKIIRESLEVDGYKVIVVQSRDLSDAVAVRQHLKNIARAVGRGDIVEKI